MVSNARAGQGGRRDWTADALDAVRAERARQDAKWGPATLSNRAAERGLTVLMEEVGEVARALLDCSPRRAVRAELVQVAAVAVAIVEAIDRGCDLALAPMTGTPVGLPVDMPTILDRCPVLSPGGPAADLEPAPASPGAGLSPLVAAIVLDAHALADAIDDAGRLLIPEAIELPRAERAGAEDFAARVLGEQLATPRARVLAHDVLFRRLGLAARPGAPRDRFPLVSAEKEPGPRGS